MEIVKGLKRNKIVGAGDVMQSVDYDVTDFIGI